MKLFLGSLAFVLAFTASNSARAEAQQVYAVAGAKVIRSTTDFYDGQKNVSYQLIEVDQPEVTHTVLFRLDPSKENPAAVIRLNELAASLDGFELDLTLRCDKAVSNLTRPLYDMSKMGCTILSIGHRRPRS